MKAVGPLVYSCRLRFVWGFIYIFSHFTLLVIYWICATCDDIYQLFLLGVNWNQAMLACLNFWPVLWWTLMDTQNSITNLVAHWRPSKDPLTLGVWEGNEARSRDLGQGLKLMRVIPPHVHSCSFINKFSYKRPHEGSIKYYWEWSSLCEWSAWGLIRDRSNFTPVRVKTSSRRSKKANQASRGCSTENKSTDFWVRPTKI